MKQYLSMGLLIAVSAAGLSACGGGGDNTVNTPPMVVVVTTQERFGATFAQIFNRDANSDPTDPVPDSAVIAISFTEEPIAIP